MLFMGSNAEFYLGRWKENPEVRGFLKGGEQFNSIPHCHVGTIYSHLGRTGNILNLIMFLPPFSPPP